MAMPCMAINRTWKKGVKNLKVETKNFLHN